MGKVKRTKRATVPRKSRKKRPHAEIGERLKELRSKLVSKQAELAELLEVDQSLVSAWEGGIDKPSPQMWLKLGNAAAEKELSAEARWCFGEAGIKPEALLFVANQRRKEQTAPAEANEVAPISPSQRVPEQAALPPLRLPSRWIPNVETTRYVLLTDRYRNPLFRAGDTLVIDESETNWLKLLGACVALYLPLPKETEPVSKAEKNIVAAAGLNAEKVEFTRQGGVSAAWLFRGAIVATEERGAGAPVYALKPYRSRISEVAGWGVRFSDNGMVEDSTFETSLLGSEGEALEEKPIILGRVVAWIPQTGSASPEV